MPVKIYEHPSGVIIGCARVSAPHGEALIVATCDARRVQRALDGDTGEQARLVAGAASGFLGKAFRAVSRAVTRPIRHVSRAAKSLARGDVDGALRHGIRSYMAQSPTGMLPGGVQMQERLLIKALPMAQQLAPLATAIPGVGPVAAPAILGATRLLARAYGGDQAAQQQIATVQQRAQFGGPQGQRYAKLAKTLNGVAGMMRKAGGAQQLLQQLTQQQQQRGQQQQRNQLRQQQLATNRAAQAWGPKTRVRRDLKAARAAVHKRRASLRRTAASGRAALAVL